MNRTPIQEDTMDLNEVIRAQRDNRRQLARLRRKLAEGGRNAGATEAAIERRRVATVTLCDRRRALTAGAV